MNVIRFIWLGMGIAAVITGRSPEFTVLCFVMSELFNLQGQIGELKNGLKSTQSQETGTEDSISRR